MNAPWLWPTPWNVLSAIACGFLLGAFLMGAKALWRAKGSA